MAKQDEQGVSIDGKDVRGDPHVSRDQPLEKLRGSVYEYDQPCDPVGTEDGQFSRYRINHRRLRSGGRQESRLRGIEQHQIAGCTRK